MKSLCRMKLPPRVPSDPNSSEGVLCKRIVELTIKKILCGAHLSVRTLEKDIRDWTKTWNE
jgi:hypothetical protein